MRRNFSVSWLVSLYSKGGGHNSVCRPGGCMKRRLTLAFVTAAVSVLALRAQPNTAGEWPQWRGPDRTGISKETGLAKSWPAGGPPKVWTASGLGNGYGSVAIAD